MPMAVATVRVGEQSVVPPAVGDSAETSDGSEAMSRTTRAVGDAGRIDVRAGARDASSPQARFDLGAYARRAIFGVSSDEVARQCRGFPGAESPAMPHLECVGDHFVHGYNTALEVWRAPALVEEFAPLPAKYRGFAYEGAAMALTLLDLFAPWRRRFHQLLVDGAGEHCYMMHVGAGWALARIPSVLRRRVLGRLDPLLRWLALDGLGFHCGFFDWVSSIVRKEVPAALHGYSRRAFDQGLGRSLWFVYGASVREVEGVVGQFPAYRQDDLWSGLGLACAYAGGVDQEAIEALRGACRSALPQVAQGAAFAAEAREKAEIPTRHTDLACRILCGTSAAAAASVARQEGRQLEPERGVPAYEVWRRRIQRRLPREAGS